MRRECEFGQAKRGAVVAIPKGKTRITIRLDKEVVEWFKQQVHGTAGVHPKKSGGDLRRVIREELENPMKPG